MKRTVENAEIILIPQSLEEVSNKKKVLNPCFYCQWTLIAWKWKQACYTNLIGKHQHLKLLKSKICRVDELWYDVKENSIKNE